MTDAAKQLNINTELQTATTTLKAARALMELGFANDAATRLYYAVLHALRALLYSKGLESRSHRGVIALYNREFVRSGDFDASTNAFIGAIKTQREVADYESEIVVTDTGLRQQYAQAEAFINAVCAKLGWQQSADVR